MNSGRMKKLILVILIALMIIIFSGCGGNNKDGSGSGEYTGNDAIEEDIIAADKIVYDGSIPDDVIFDNLVYDNYLYECTINDDIICDIVLIDIVVGETAEDEITDQLPEVYKDYDIEWGKVIGKYAAGTAIIVAVGFIDYATNGQAAYFFGTPATIAKDAFAGAVAGAVINTSIECEIDGKPTEQKIRKYAIEGSADGYMWGAITSATKNIVRKQKLQFSDGMTAKILKDGNVVSESDTVIGKAAYIDGKIYFYTDEEMSYPKAVFSSSGKHLSNEEKHLPANSAFQQSRNGPKQYTDDKGIIYRIGDNLRPNITYTLNGYKYSTDEFGRIKMISGELKLKDSEKLRSPITDSMETIAKGSQKEGDQRGHLIADMFGGDNTMANIVPMRGDLNTSEYKKMENLWKKILEEGKKVEINGELVYKGKTQRMNKIIMRYKIDNGDEVVKEFVN